MGGIASLLKVMQWRCRSLYDRIGRKKARFLWQCLVFACSFDASVLQVDLVRILVVFVVSLTFPTLLWLAYLRWYSTETACLDQMSIGRAEGHLGTV